MEARAWSYLAALVALLAATPCRGQSDYIVELSNDHYTEWTGTAKLTEGVNGALSGELCLVRKEYIDRPAGPRTLLHLPITGRREGNSLQLQIPNVPTGPNFNASNITLDSAPDENGDVSVEKWEFGDRGEMFDEEGEPTRSDVARFLTLRRGSKREKEVGPLGDTSRYLVYKQPIDESDDSDHQEQSYIYLETYDRLSPDEAIAFEKKQIFSNTNVFEDRYVNVYADSSNFKSIQEFLSRLGHGTRILNSEIQDCNPTKLLFGVTVPEGLEVWYARRLQTSGLVIAAFPSIQAMDPSWSTAITLGSAAIAAAVRNAQLRDTEKYKIVWQEFDRILRRFVDKRRPGFSSSGSIARHGTSAVFMFRAEIAGKALAVCDTNRWEKMIVNATANSFDPRNGHVVLAINFADGFFAKGPQAPSQSRWQDNTITDGDLARLQDLFIGVLQGNAAVIAKCTK